MGGKHDEWFVSRGGQRFGPVGFDTLVESAKAGRLEPRTDLVIGGDLEDWVPAGQIDGIFERNDPAEKDEVAPGDHRPPADSLADSGSYDFGEKQTKLKLPGAPRLGYLLGVTVLPAILAIGLGKVMPQLQAALGPDFGRFVPLVVLVVPLVVLVITVKRFQNLAMSGWWVVGLLVPILNWWLNYRLVACPPGYGFTKKLDVWGWILAVLYWLSLVGSMVLFFLFGITMIKEMYESGEFREFKNQWEQLKSVEPPPR